jgi:putative transposase
MGKPHDQHHQKARRIVGLAIIVQRPVARAASPGGVRWVVVESLAVKHQLLIMKRSRRRAPNLTAWDRLMLGFWTLLVSPKRLRKIAVIIKPSTLLRLHQALVKRKCHLLCGSNRARRPGPKGPSSELIAAVVEMKRRNPRWGCRKMPSKSPVPSVSRSTRMWSGAYSFTPPDTRRRWASWLSIIGQARDSVWSVDLFRCESILPQSYWVMLVMDVFTRWIIGFGVAAANLDGPSVCRMFHRAIAKQRMPKHLFLGSRSSVSFSALAGEASDP